MNTLPQIIFIGVAALTMVACGSNDDDNDPVVAADPLVQMPGPGVVTPDPVATPDPVDPVVADPVVADPVVADPVVADPVVADPVVADPVVADPVVADPVVAVDDGSFDSNITTTENAAATAFTANLALFPPLNNIRGAVNNVINNVPDNTTVDATTCETGDARATQTGDETIYEFNSCETFGTTINGSYTITVSSLTSGADTVSTTNEIFDVTLVDATSLNEVFLTTVNGNSNLQMLSRTSDICFDLVVEDTLSLDFPLIIDDNITVNNLTTEDIITRTIVPQPDRCRFDTTLTLSGSGLVTVDSTDGVFVVDVNRNGIVETNSTGGFVSSGDANARLTLDNAATDSAINVTKTGQTTALIETMVGSEIITSEEVEFELFTR